MHLNGGESRRIDEAYLAAPHLRRGTPEPISHVELAGCLEYGARSRALFCWNVNIAASNPPAGTPSGGAPPR